MSRDSRVSFSVKAMMTALMLFGWASACYGQEDLPTHLSQLRSAQPSQYDSIIESALKNNPTAEALIKAIRDGVSAQPDESRKEKLVAGWSAWEATDSKGVTRPYQIFMPKNVSEGAKPAALIVHMHGAVGRPEFGTGLGTPQATGYAGILWPEVAEAENLVVVCPVGRQDCMWWTDNGVLHVDAVIRDVRRTMDFSDDSIFGAGFSDGGSGCYYRAMADPGPFAGFIALNGHPMVAATASNKQIYLPNMAMSTTIAAMTQEDSLYPSKNVMPHILTAIQNGANVLTVSYPKMNHQPSYFADQKMALLSFMKGNKLKTKMRVAWQASSVELGKFQWMEILEFTDSKNAVEVADSNVMSTPGRLQVGIQLSPTGATVNQVIEGSVAEAAGMKAGDEFLEFDGEAVENSRKLRALIRKKSNGDKFLAKVKRGDKEMELNGKFPPFVSKPVYVRKDPTGVIDCRWTKDTPSIELKTKNVARLRVWLPAGMGELKKVKMTLNGQQSELEFTKRTAEEILADFAKTASAASIYTAYAEIEVGAK